MTYHRNSPYVKFAKAYCDKMGFYTINELNKREYFKDKFDEAMIIKHLFENRNRKGK